MKITSVSELYPSQKEKIQSLVDRCHDFDGPFLSFPFEDASYFLYIDGCSDPSRSIASLCREAAPQPCPVSSPDSRSGCIAAMALTVCGEDAWECSAFVQPDFRRQGLFSALLDQAIDLLPEESDLYFLIDSSTEAAGAVLELLGAELVSKEHMMELSLDDFLRQEPELAMKSYAEEFSPAKAEGGFSAAVSEDCSSSQLCYRSSFGQVSISLHSDGCYLYGFEILPEFRRQGHGTRFLFETLTDLAVRNLFPVRLQVSGSNQAALSLYKKTGFRITETLLSFLY